MDQGTSGGGGTTRMLPDYLRFTILTELGDALGAGVLLYQC